MVLFFRILNIKDEELRLQPSKLLGRNTEARKLVSMGPIHSQL